MPTINATISQGGYLVTSAATAFSTWEDVCYTITSATSIFTNPQYMYTRASFSGGRGGTWNCGRSYLVFDTSAITGTLTSLSLNVWVDSINDLIYTPNAIVQLTYNPNLSTSLANSDWQYVYEPNTSDPFYPSTQGWETVGLNATAAAVAEGGSEMSLILRDHYYDYDYFTNFATPPGEGNIQYFYNEAGYVPYLEYTMTVAGYGQTVNGIIPANMASVDGVLKANISKVLGV